MISFITFFHGEVLAKKAKVVDANKYSTLSAHVPRPVARIWQQGAKNHKRGAQFLITILDLCCNRRAKHEMGTQILDEGRAPLPLPQAIKCMYLVFLRCDAGQQGSFCSVVFIGSD